MLISLQILTLDGTILHYLVFDITSLLSAGATQCRQAFLLEVSVS